ncbi:nucleotide exchange factor GrpE [Dongia sp. agr-C8]
MMTDDKMDNGTTDEQASQIETGESLEEALAAARAEAAQMKDQALRAMAEAENTRKRAQRDREDAQKYGITNFAREMLTVADNLRRALEAIPAETLQSDEALKNLYDGVAATERQLEAALGKQQIQRIWPEGERFDSNFHQAMFEVPDSGKPAGTVVQVLQAGYKIHDRLLRPALVGVAKGGAAAANDAAPGGNVDTTA